MTKPKPISFRPDVEDQVLVDTLIEHFSDKGMVHSKADILRMAITSLATTELGFEKTVTLIGNAKINNR